MSDTTWTRRVTEWLRAKGYDARERVWAGGTCVICPIPPRRTDGSGIDTYDGVVYVQRCPDGRYHVSDHWLEGIDAYSPGTAARTVIRVIRRNIKERKRAGRRPTKLYSEEAYHELKMLLRKVRDES